MHPIPLTHTLFEGNNTVYLFGESGEGPLTLVDSGTDTPQIRDQLEAGIAEAGYEVEDIDQVLLTHFHSDHAGLAHWIQSRSDAWVRAHPIDADLIAPNEETSRRFRAQYHSCFDAWGMPPEKQAEISDILRRDVDSSSHSLAIDSVEDGDVVRAGSRTLTVHHLPGHTAGHVCYEDSDERVLWSGDVLLPKYTPNVGGADVRLDAPLTNYLETLERVVGLSPLTAWPGHRNRIDDPVERARVILAHHRERTKNVIDVLRIDGPSTPWEVSAALFGDLHDIHVLHGPGEASAHLRHLESGDIVTAEDGRYRLLEGQPDLDSFFPQV